MSWIKRADEREAGITPHPQGADGEMKWINITDNDEELMNKGRLFKEITLEKGCGVGYHIHNGDAEYYLVLAGEAEYDDNGTKTTIKAGDVTYTPPGEGHGVLNVKDEPFKIVALILYE